MKKYKHVFFISPPFYSHFNPLLVFAKSFKKYGVEVTFGCSLEFKDNILNEDLNFYEIDISKNKNIGSTENTVQPDTEKMRLEEFFESTKKGAVETLITQSKHRKADMLYNPDELVDKIRDINNLLNIDLFIVDVLSYSVTLSLYFLGLPFVTFCPPHPGTIPAKGKLYGLPINWPSIIKISDEDLSRLKQVLHETQREFTDIFNKMISKNEVIKETDNAFRLVSEIAIVYNYFDFNNIEDQDDKPVKIFMGNCFKKEFLDKKWQKIIDSKEKKIIITLGTFLSNRKDVLEKLLVYLRDIYPQALLIVSAGSNAKNLRKYSSDHTIIEEFIPQIALLPYVDIIIFHGGCNSFTEALYYNKKMIILPFSSDQFNIAYDAEKNELGSVLDPNNFNKDDLLKAFNTIDTISGDKSEYWSNLSRERGADYAVKKLLMAE